MIGSKNKKWDLTFNMFKAFTKIAEYVSKGRNIFFNRWSNFSMFDEMVIKDIKRDIYHNKVFEYYDKMTAVKHYSENAYIRYGGECPDDDEEL